MVASFVNFVINDSVIITFAFVYFIYNVIFEYLSYLGSFYEGYEQIRNSEKICLFLGKGAILSLGDMIFDSGIFSNISDRFV